MELRPYQANAIGNLRALIKAGKKKVILICPTGGGKTVIAAELIRLMKFQKKKALFMVHRDTLIDQAYDKFTRIGASITVCKSGDSRVIEDWDVMVATIQTLRNRALPEVDCVFVDECHLSAANSWVKVLNNFSCPIIGLTATPFRLDGRALSSIYDKQLLVASMKDLLQNGSLSPLKWYVPSGFGAKHGDAYDAWMKYAQGKKTIIFANGIEHSLNIEQKFNGLVKHVGANTPVKERQAILSDFKNDKLLGITNVNILSEGYDVPSCECIILAGKTKSLAIFLQRIGRGMRPYADKNHCIILDLAGNLAEHGYPEDIDMSISEKPANSKSYRPQLIIVTICKNCFLAIPKYPCHNCAHTTSPKEIREEKVVLENSEIKYPKGSLKYYVEQGKKHGYKNGWAYYQWRSRRHAPSST